MNCLITVNNKKKIKFVFDETINHKEGWISRRCTRAPADQMMAVLPPIEGVDNEEDNDEDEEDENIPFSELRRKLLDKNHE